MILLVPDSPSSVRSAFTIKLEPGFTFHKKEKKKITLNHNTDVET